LRRLPPLQKPPRNGVTRLLATTRRQCVARRTSYHPCPYAVRACLFQPSRNTSLADMVQACLQCGALLVLCVYPTMLSTSDGYGHSSTTASQLCNSLLRPEETNGLYNSVPRLPSAGLWVFFVLSLAFPLHSVFWSTSGASLFGTYFNSLVFFAHC